MITFVQCIRRREGMSDAEFHEHWQLYEEEIRTLAAASRAVRCEVSRVLSVSENLAVMARRGSGAPFDGMVEISWRSGAQAIQDIGRSEAAAPIAAMQAHQETFIDLARSSFFFTHQEVAFDRT
jgi:hypothetical protein